jgi:hypothetical protein
MSPDPLISLPDAASRLRPLPKYRRHKASGQGVATIGGRDFYFGPYGTKASKAEYDRRCAEWLAAKRPTYTAASVSGLTVNELILRFWKYASTYYPPETLKGTLKPPLRRLRLLYGPTRATEFGPEVRRSDSPAARSIALSVGFAAFSSGPRASRLSRLRSLTPLPPSKG